MCSDKYTPGSSNDSDSPLHVPCGWLLLATLLLFGFTLRTNSGDISLLPWKSVGLVCCRGMVVNCNYDNDIHVTVMCLYILLPYFLLSGFSHTRECGR